MPPKHLIGYSNTTVYVVTTFKNLKIALAINKKLF